MGGRPPLPRLVRMSAEPEARRAAEGAEPLTPPADDAPGPALPAGGTDDGTVDAVDRGTTRTPVEVDDAPSRRIHHPGDLLQAVLSAVGVVLVMVLATWAHGTTEGVSEDVQGFASILQGFLFVPVALLEGLVLLVVPLAVVAELAMRRLGRQVLDALVAAVVAVALNSLVLWLVTTLDVEQLQLGLSARPRGSLVVTLPAYVAIVAALLTVSGPRQRFRTVRWSWNLLWLAMGVAVITGTLSLTGAVASLLLGRAAGLAVRYASGVRAEQAYGSALVAGVRHAGFDPVRLRRIEEDEEDEPADAAARAVVRATDHRVYAMTTADGRELDVVVLDGDRQVVGMLARLWRSIRLRGIEGRTIVSLRQAAERRALMLYAADAAGVSSTRLLGLAEAEDSVVFVQEPAPRAVTLGELPEDRLTDALLRTLWEELNTAHAAGLAHRNLTSDTILVDDSGDRPRVLLTTWELGDIASSSLARRIDVTQLVALLAVRVGAERALASAVASLLEADVEAIGPLLQTITLPRRTRDEIRQARRSGHHAIARLREALVERIPEADVEPQQLTRFGLRTILTIFVPIVAVIYVVTTINIEQISEAIADSDWRWAVVAFALGLVTLVGAALAFVAFSPVRLSLWRATLVQTAATFVALAAPAGIGPAALNLRMLTRRGVSGSLAAATVALVQVSQFIVTLALLLVLTLVSGRQDTTLTISPTMLVVIGAVVALVAAALLVPRVRQLAVARIMPIVRQTWPRLLATLSQPSRLALAFGGNLLMTLGFILAFDACLAAFGQDASLIQVAIVYLAGNTAGALVPTPGGMGTVEVALAATLSAVTGINTGVATYVAVLFRVATYWLRIPIGWVAMRYLQKTGEL